MTDPVIADLIGRVTKLEVANDVNLPQLLQRLQRLEEQLGTMAEQARVDKEQADRREMADLRAKLATAEQEAARLREEQRINGAVADLTGGKR